MLRAASIASLVPIHTFILARHEIAGSQVGPAAAAQQLRRAVARHTPLLSVLPSEQVRWR